MSVPAMIYLCMLIVAVLLLIVYGRTGKLFKCLFFTLFSGFGALGIVWILGRFISIPLSITPLSLVVSGVLGIPGVVGMLLLHLI